MERAKITGICKIAAPSLPLLAAMYGFLMMAVPIATLKEPVDIEVQRGMNFRQAATVFQKQGFVRDINFFVALGRLTGVHKRLAPGYYRFDGRVTPWAVFNALKDGLIIKWEVAVIEGDTLLDIREKLVSKKIMSGSSFDKFSKDVRFMASNGIYAPSLEGYLFPDTYSIPKGTEPREVFEMMVERLREMFDAPLLEKARAVGLSEKEALTLASIIEKEASVESERPVISAVYHNRLKKGMPLQADPTAIYGIKSQREGITKSDLLRKTAYNTYVIKGLPPGPIASPGIESIKAALNPADAPYIYFVSNNDGTHTFTSNFEEHKKAVELYRAKKESMTPMENAVSNGTSGI